MVYSNENGICAGGPIAVVPEVVMRAIVARIILRHVEQDTS
jgi:hypothetical protein